MPRNSSGTYSLPAGNPVVSGTLIEASWANSTLSDLASAMTGSLSRAGEGGMTAALRLYDGTVSLPGLAFSNETSTGLYRAGTGDMRLAVTGSQVMQFLTTGVAVTGTLSASGNATLSGTLAVTGASTFSGQTNTFENSTAYYPQLINRNKTADANGSYISLQKIRNTSVVQNGDVLGNVIFSGYDGAAYLQGAYINAVVSAAPGTNDMPTDLAFGTTPDGSAGPSERLRITQAGNVGIGTNSPGAKFELYGGRAKFVGNSDQYNIEVKYNSSTTGGWVGSPATDVLAFYRGSSGTESARFDSSGNFGIGTTSPSTYGKLAVAGNIGTTGNQLNVYPGSDYEFVQRSSYKMNFYVNGASVLASLSLTGVWTNASDSRYKENIVDSQYGLSTVMALKPRSYNLIGLEGKPQVGFIAQEVLEVVPEVVESVYNSVTEEDRYTLSYGNLTAVLTKAIQEQQAMIAEQSTLITTLTERISALEATP